MSKSTLQNTVYLFICMIDRLTSSHLPFCPCAPFGPFGSAQTAQNSTRPRPNPISSATNGPGKGRFEWEIWLTFRRSIPFDSILLRSERSQKEALPLQWTDLRQKARSKSSFAIYCVAHKTNSTKRIWSFHRSSFVVLGEVK